MSDRASSWAWQQRGLRTGSKIILLALADEADDDGVAWVGSKNVAARCEVKRQTVSNHIRWFEGIGLLKISERYNLEGQRTRNLYRLQLGVNRTDEGLSEDLSGLSKDLTTASHNGTPSVAEGPVKKSDMPVQRFVGPVKNPDSFPSPSPDLSLNDLDPEEREGEDGWFETLTSIGRPSDTRLTADRFNGCQAWLDQQRITDDLAYATAIDLKAKWGGPGWKYHDVWATFQKWCRVAQPKTPAGRYY